MGTIKNPPLLTEANSPGIAQLTANDSEYGKLGAVHFATRSILNGNIDASQEKQFRNCLRNFRAGLELLLALCRSLVARFYLRQPPTKETDMATLHTLVLFVCRRHLV